MAIPCPLRRWNEKAREKMLVCLPLVGLAVGGIWLGLYLLLRHAAIGGLYAFLMAALPWLVTGFMHLDGYMDVCDAVLSRRELATRQRILKDSHCGAFAVIGMVLLALCQWSVFLSGSADESLWGLLLIPVATRACAGLAVLKLRPMGTSQYAAMGRHGGTPLPNWPKTVPLGRCCWRRRSPYRWSRTAASPPWRQQRATGWRYGTASGSWTA